MEKLEIYLFLFVTLFLLEVFYNKIAKFYKIQAIPNHRSSHSTATITGAGIIIPAAYLIYFWMSDFKHPLLMTGVMLVAFISLMDDIKEVSIKIRLLVHLFAISLVFVEFDVFSINFFLVLLTIVITIISVNAYNFIDGINGITVAYSLIQFITFYYINHYKIHFVDDRLLFVVGTALLVFMYFNFRVKAKCFAGDIGSISIAFIICACIIKLILQTKNLLYINFLLVYYLDAVSTFIFRWIQGKNVLKAHKEHFYQYLANGKKWQHTSVAVLFSVIQLLINLSLLHSFSLNGNASNHYNFFDTILISGLSFTAFAYLRIKLEGNGLINRKRLIDDLTENSNNQTLSVVKD